MCQSIDVRNLPIDLLKLKHCRVIEGFLQILLMDNAVAGDYDNYTFPLLTEITDFFLVYRVSGLRSLGKMFPNLSIIGGHNLFSNYALVIFEVLQMEEVGLHSLKYIGRGGVRLEKNALMCHTETVDWTRLVNGTHHEANMFLKNRLENECPVCPGGNQSESLHNCPILNYSRKKYACWNPEHCQVMCPAKCPWNCDNAGNCCDKSCIGGCSLGNPKNCTRCKNYVLGTGPDRICVDECPATHYKHMNRRCIDRDECIAIRKPIFSSHSTPTKPYITFDGECRLSCPELYEIDRVNQTCTRCPNSTCKKSCEAAKIDSIAAAQQMEGCQIITGDLDIQIRREGGRSVVSELDKFLSKIEVIDGHLKISRSDPLLSLRFLKSLRLIRGLNKIEGGKYANKSDFEPSFTLSENDNLQELFAENQTVTIHNGLLNFHMNPRLCFSRIERVLKGYVPPLNTSVYQALFEKSNGDRGACNVQIFNATLISYDSTMAWISWNASNVYYQDERALLGFVVQYRAAPYQNVTLFDGRDACGFDGWENNDVSVEDSGFLFTYLQPATQYAFYVKTVQLSNSPNGGRTDITYFTTKPDVPDPVRNARVKVGETNSITLAWDPPKKANGNLTKYIVVAQRSSSNLTVARNYCLYREY